MNHNILSFDSYSKKDLKSRGINDVFDLVVSRRSWMLESIQGNLKQLTADLKGIENLSDDEVTKALMALAKVKGDTSKVNIDSFDEDTSESPDKGNEDNEKQPQQPTPGNQDSSEENSESPDKTTPEVSERSFYKALGLDGRKMNESAEISSTLVILEEISSILGNSALIEWISTKVEKLTGKKIEPSKLVSALNKVSGWIKKASGLPAKIIQGVFSYLAKIMGAGEKMSHLIGKIGLGIGCVLLLTLCISLFPHVLAGGSVLKVAYCMLGMVGKVVEIQHLVKKIYQGVMDMKKSPDTAPEIPGVSDLLSEIEDSGLTMAEI